jgi:excisionase family DNA binding protein
MSDSLLTPSQVADMLCVKQSTVYHWSHIGFIPTVRLGKLIRFRKKSIVAWIEKRESKGRSKRKYQTNIEGTL